MDQAGGGRAICGGRIGIICTYPLEHQPSDRCYRGRLGNNDDVRAMRSNEESAFASRSARELRTIADHTPEIADDLREMADQLDAKAAEGACMSGARLIAASSFGRLFRRLRA